MRAGEPHLEDAAELIEGRGRQGRGTDAAWHHKVNRGAGALLVVECLRIHLVGASVERK